MAYKLTSLHGRRIYPAGFEGSLHPDRTYERLTPDTASFLHELLHVRERDLSMYDHPIFEEPQIGRTLVHLDIDNVEFMGVDFSGCTMHRCVFHNCEFIDCSFEGAVLDHTSFQYSSLYGCVFDGAELDDVDLKRSELSTFTMGSIGRAHGTVRAVVDVASFTSEQVLGAVPYAEEGEPGGHIPYWADRYILE